MAEPTDWIKEAQQVGVELKEAIREAHGLLRDIRGTRREVEELSNLMVERVGSRAKAAFNQAFNEGLEMFSRGLLEQTDEAFQRVDKMAEQALAALTTDVIKRMEDLIALRSQKLL